MTPPNRWIGLEARARQLIYSHRRLVALTIYAGIATVSYYLAYTARFELVWPEQYVGVFLWTLPLLVLLRLIANATFRISTGRWRFVSTHDVLRLAGATLVGSVAFLLVTRLLPLDAVVPLSVIAIECVLTGYFTAALWMTYRLGYEELRQRKRAHNGEPLRRVLIVGAGEAGNLLAREMVRYPTGLRPIGFVDDDPTKWGSSIHGIEVIGATMDLAAIARQLEADELILAMPSATPAEMRQVVGIGEGTGLPYKILPGIREVLEGRVSLQHLREVEIEDLLGREPVELELPELEGDIGGRTVLVTGAAGSIGAELSRQAALHGPTSLVLVDQAETPLFYLGLEMRERHPDMEIVTCVGDVVDGPAIECLFRQYKPDRVYHAAAYKHVPMMETSPREAMRNNVLGTMRVADAAGRHGTAKFVLVSTDKAVTPSNVMGASKRLAELVVLELQQRYPRTTYSAVRFGNVLGSQGSVIPIFKRQLREGRPLTVTHPDATRYFMTIPEAVQLILQASLLPEIRGQIAMLEMGEPVKIMDLAQNLLRLSGATGSKVVITGLRPGEKLHEQLVGPDEEWLPTEMEKIRIVAHRNGRVHNLLERALCWSEDYPEDRLLAELREVFPSLNGHGEPSLRALESMSARA